MIGGVILAKKLKGVTLIEALIDVAILMMVSAAIIGAYAASFKSMDYAKAKMAAVALANEKMEELRNMPYDSLATEHGTIYPSGDILDNEEVVRNGVSLRIHTAISYVDDPFDGNAEGTISGKPVDLYPYDYKKAEISIYKTGNTSRLSVLTSNIAAKAAETPSNTGVIKLCVIDSLGNPLSDASVKITNSVVSPAVDIESTTGDDGCIFVPNLPPNSHHTYHLEATKDGYSTDMTYSWRSQNPHQIQPDVNVVLQQVTIQVLAIDRLSTMNVHLVDQNGTALVNHTVHIQGEKQIYFQGNKQLKYSQDKITDASGNIALTNMEFDNYSFTVSGMTILSVSPFMPVDLNANETKNVQIVASASSGLMVVSDLTPVSGAKSQTSYFTLTGSNFSGTTLKLVNGSTEIAAINLTIESGNIEGEFPIGDVPIGKYDLVIQQGSQTITQSGAFEVTN